VSRALIAGVCGAAIAAFAWFTVVAQGFAAPDESWFLQVVARLQSGDTLYRDVYFNVTPLSMYVTLALTSVFPIELAVVRGVVVAALAGTVALCWLVCRELRVGWVAAWLLVCAWNRPAPYTPLAMLFFAAAFYSTVRWMRQVHTGIDTRRDLACAGAAAGLCFAAKQNLGLYCLGAVLLSLWIVNVRRRRGIRLVLSVFALTASAILLPVFVTGGFKRYLIYGFAKTTYLETSYVPYSAVFERFLAAAGGSWSFEKLATGYREFAFLLPLAAFGLLAAAWLRSSGTDRQRVSVVTTFVAAGYLVVFPQFGGSLIMFAIPILVVGLAYGWNTVSPLVSRPSGRAIQVAITLLFAVQIGFRFVRDVIRVASPAYVTSEIRHFRGLRVREDEHRALIGQTGLLSDLSAGQPLYLIGPNAGFFYLAAGIRNPSAFDFPYASVFGRNGQQEVIARIAGGEIRSVFVFAGPIDRQTPVTLLDFVRSSLLPVREEPLGVHYQGSRGR
jgi:hypothetical protein